MGLREIRRSEEGSDEVLRRQTLGAGVALAFPVAQATGRFFWLLGTFCEGNAAFPVGIVVGALPL